MFQKNYLILIIWLTKLKNANFMLWETKFNNLMKNCLLRINRSLLNAKYCNLTITSIFKSAVNINIE